MPMTRHKHKKPFIKLRSFYIWHRYMGLTVIVFAILLALTGLALNHTASLELDRQPVNYGWLLDWYEVEAPQRIISYAAGDNAISLVEDQLYVDARSIGGHYVSLAGAVRLQDMIVIAADTHILLLTPEGEIIERLTDVNNQVQTIAAVGLREPGELIIRTNDAAYLTDGNFSRWQNIQPGNNRLSWATPAKIPEDLRDRLKRHYRANILTMERVMLDLHSGRIFGNAGVIVFDIAAVIFILLSVTGSWIWVQQQRKRASHRRRRAPSN